MYKELWRQVNSKKEVSRWLKKGFCRSWSNKFSQEVKKMAEEKGFKVETELREVDVATGLSHTFVKIWIGEEEAYFCDGVGVETHEPYFGPESKAPTHLRGSRLDMIEIYNNTE